PHNAFVFVGDGRKALFLHNAGDEKFLNLKTERMFVTTIRPHMSKAATVRAALSSAPGRTSAAVSEIPTGTNSKSTASFGALPAGREQVGGERKAKALVIVAPPRTLADLRRAVHADVKERIIAEIGKDLTKHPVHEIEKHLVG